MSGLVEVRIETASGTEVEGLLSALSEDDARDLMEGLDAARSSHLEGPELTDEADWPVIVDTQLSDLVWYGVTGVRLGSMAVLFGVLFQLATYNDPEQMERLPGLFGAAGGVALLVAVFSGAWVVSVVGAVGRFWGFRLRQKADALVAEQGLFTRRRVELGRRKVQIVSVLEPALRRLYLRVASLQVETAAVRDGGDGTQRASAMVPVVHAEQLDDVLSRVLPIDAAELASLPLRPPAERALIRGLIGALWRSVLVAGFLLWLLGWWGLPVLLWVPASLVLAWLDHRHQGWAITDDLIVSRRGWLHRRTELVARHKMQSVDRMQGPLLRRYGLGQVRVRVAGGAVALPLVGWEEAASIQQALIDHAADRRVPREEVVDDDAGEE
jgi:putative membrane protein